MNFPKSPAIYHQTHQVFIRTFKRITYQHRKSFSLPVTRKNISFYTICPVEILFFKRAQYFKFDRSFESYYGRIRFACILTAHKKFDYTLHDKTNLMYDPDIDRTRLLNCKT